MASNRTFNVQALYIDAATLASMNSSSLPYAGQLGQFFTKDGKLYQLVKFKSTTTTIAAGTAVSWNDFDDFVVSAEADDWTCDRNAPAGVALGTVTAGNFAFIQVAGVYSAVVYTAAAAVAGDTIIIGSTDGSTNRVAKGTASTYVPLGIATAADSAGTISVRLTCPLNC